MLFPAVHARTSDLSYGERFGRIDLQVPEHVSEFTGTPLRICEHTNLMSLVLLPSSSQLPTCELRYTMPMETRGR